jgi:hypothetical protein
MARGPNFPDEIGILNGTPSDAKKRGMYLLLCKLIEYAQRRSWVWAVIESQIDTLGIIKSPDHLAAQGNQIGKILPKCRSADCRDRARREMGDSHLIPNPEPEKIVILPPLFLHTDVTASTAILSVRNF